ncbi:MAG: mannose-1-phosphate guanylyltransferase/mannose-6-phosphate isomerase [Desulfovibrionaceae bacterium]
MTVTSGATADTFFDRCHAIILAGGSGTRLWPMSRSLLPKQFLMLNGDRSLLQQTVARARTVFAPERTRIVTNEEHVFEVRKQIGDPESALGETILAEPLGRNTLPAILLGLDAVVKADPDALVAVLPSDHLIHRPEQWRGAVGRALELAADGWFVTFGIEPVHPETGYGYIRRGASLGRDAFEVHSFTEKPDLEKARAFVDSGEYYWNSGMFVFSAARFLDAVERLQPELWAWWLSRETHPLAAGYGALPEVSVDYGVMERVERIAVVRGEFGWDDLGSWEAVFRLGEKSRGGCVIQGDVLPLGCANSLLFSTGAKLAAVGVKDMIVVQTHDATLLCALDQVQKVKDVVGLLKQQGSPLVETHVTVRRPWGSYTVLEGGEFYKIKRIEVTPGAKLSLQKHHHRSEHWVVIRGEAAVHLDGDELLLAQNQSVDIPIGAVHRLGNPGTDPLEIIEIQSGSYLEEDDIVRFEDVYGRLVDPD